jgi:hypothetical protein
MLRRHLLVGVAIISTMIAVAMIEVLLFTLAIRALT